MNQKQFDYLLEYIKNIDKQLQELENRVDGLEYEENE